MAPAPPPRTSKRAASTASKVAAWLAERAVDRINEAHLEELGRALPQVKEAALRKALRDSGLPMDPLVEGVRQDSFGSLARTLTGLQREYESAAGGERRKRIRALVLEARKKVEFALRRLSDNTAAAAEKREMGEWMLVWLRDPALFETWAKLRMARLGLADAHTGEVAEPDTDEADADG